MKKYYYLFGEQECAAYNEGGIKEVMAGIEDESLNSNLYCYDETTPISQVLSDFCGFEDYVELTEEEYMLLQYDDYASVVQIKCAH